MTNNLSSINLFGAIFSIAILSDSLFVNNAIAKSTESHTIDFLAEGGSFCALWLASDRNKPHKIIAAPQGSLFMKIDGKDIAFKRISSSGNSNGKLGSRSISTYKADRFNLKLNLVLTIPSKGNTCYQEQQGEMIITTNNWKKVIQVKEGCDPCG